MIRFVCVLFLMQFLVVLAEASASNADFCKYSSTACKVYDPYEKMNRRVFKFNKKIDKILLKPAAKAYQRCTSAYLRARVTNFLENLSTPLTVINYGLQLDAFNAVKSFWRFAMNSTFGVVGIFDIAHKMQINVNKQTFGNTLAHYGCSSGAYLMMPLLGATNMRDILDILLWNNLMDPLQCCISGCVKRPIFVVNIVNTRESVLNFTDNVERNSADEYIAFRSAVYQNRENSVQYPESFVCPKR